MLQKHASNQKAYSGCSHGDGYDACYIKRHNKTGDWAVSLTHQHEASAECVAAVAADLKWQVQLYPEKHCFDVTLKMNNAFLS